MKSPVETAESERNENPPSVQPILTFPQGAPAAQSSPLLIDSLLLRMRAGDRDAAAAFLVRYGSRIRRRIRGKLGPSIRRLFDSLEILSTLGRRLDLYVMSGRLQAANEAQLWSLIFKIADNAVIDKARLFSRLQSIEGEDGEFAQTLMLRFQQVDDARSDDCAVEFELEHCIQSLADPVDRKILLLWLAGEQHTEIALHVDLTPTAVRKRWEKIKLELKGRLAAVA